MRHLRGRAGPVVAGAFFLVAVAAAQDRPHAYFLLIDTSGSMAEVPKASKGQKAWTISKMAEVQKQLGLFCDALPAETEVLTFSFDREFREGPHVLITGGDAERQQLRTFFRSLVPIGKATYAWTSLNRVLGKAAEFAKDRPGTRVRVLMFTDGEDNDPGKPDLRKILKNYEQLLKDQCEPTVVTLGFTLATDAAAALDAYGIRHVGVFDSADLLPLMASFDWSPRQPTTRDEVQFFQNSSGTIVAAQWDFGDGAQAQDKSPRHRFAKAQEYLVRLTIRDSKGKFSTSERNIVIAEPGQTTPMARAVPAEVEAGEAVQFLDESKGTITKWAWTFGDRSDPSSERNPSHVYAAPGDYTATLTITGSDGDQSACDVHVLVRASQPPSAPVAEFTCAPREVTVGEPVEFFDRSSGQITERTWNFGDGSPASADRDPQHRFEKEGEYSVTLTCRGPGGEHASSTQLVVKPLPPLTARFVIGVREPIAGKDVTFTDVSSGLVERAVWEFGEQPPVEVDYTGLSGEQTRSVQHAFPQSGTYKVKLTVSGPRGTAASEQTVTAIPETLPPKAAFEQDVVRGTAPLTVRFRNNSRGMVRGYVWDFGDGEPPQETTDALQPVEHQFARPGTYQVRLTAEGTGEHAPDHATATITVLAPPPPPTWLQRHLGLVALAAGGVLALGAIGVLVWRQLARRRELKTLRLVEGPLVFKRDVPGSSWGPPISGNGETLEFDCAAALDPRTPEAERLNAPKGAITAEVDGETREVMYLVKLSRNGKPLDTFRIAQGRDVKKHGFVFRLS